MTSNETLEHLLALVRFYKQKMDDGTLSGSEGNIYLRALMLLGLRDATVRSRNLEQLSNSVEYEELPFDAKNHT
jgi:hypothetical protein